MTPLLSVRPLAARMAEFAAGTLRGFALDADKAGGYTPRDFADMAATGANVCRAPIRLKKNAAGTGYLPPDLKFAINALTQCAPLGIRVIVVLSPLPDGQAAEWWINCDLQQDLPVQWVAIAQALKGYPALQAYDLINEPVGAPVLPGDGTGKGYKAWWLSIAQAMCTALRSVDADTPLMVEPANWGNPDQFWLFNMPKATGVVASFHWYQSNPYCMQGINGYPMPLPLPADTGTSVLTEARKIAARYGIPVFVGEMNAIRWAPGRELWLARSFALFKTEKWGWCVHVWRGWEGWDPEILGTVAPFTGTPAMRTSTSPALLAIIAGIKG